MMRFTAAKFYLDIPSARCCEEYLELNKDLVTIIAHGSGKYFALPHGAQNGEDKKMPGGKRTYRSQPFRITLVHMSKDN